MNQLNVSSELPASQEERSGTGWAMGLLAIPILMCCGLPVVVGIFAAMGVLAKGISVGVVVALVGLASWLFLRRRTRAEAACCVSPYIKRSSADSSEVDHPL